MMNDYNYEGFIQHHNDNPEIYDKFVLFSKQAAQSREHYSAWTVMNRIRWHTEVEEKNSDFKINNNWIAFYARKFMEDYPQHIGFFKTRDMTH